MFRYAGSAVLFWAVCLLLTLLSRKNLSFFHRPAFVVAGVAALFLGFAGLVGGAAAVSRAIPEYGPLFVLGAFVPGLAFLMPWIRHAVSIFAEEGRRSVLGLDAMKVRRGYDGAEARMHERRFDDAEREFLIGAGQELDDPEPLRRAGDAALAAGRVESAVGHFRAALARVASDEDRASLGIRIAEIEEGRLGDPAGARRTLEGLLPALATGKWGDYVRERLGRLA